MYGKYKIDRVNKEKSIYKEWGILDKYNIIRESSLVYLYSLFVENISKLKKIYPYKRISMEEIKEADENDIWRWENHSEKKRTVKDIKENGMLLPVIVLDKGIGNNGMPPSDKFNVLDGNHRISALRDIGVKKINAFIFPEECIDVVNRIKSFIPKEKDKIKPVKLSVLTPSIDKMNIDIAGIDNSKLVVKGEFYNRVSAYNAGMAIAHELTPFLYEYYLFHGGYPKYILSNNFKISEVAHV